MTEINGHMDKICEEGDRCQMENSVFLLSSGPTKGRMNIRQREGKFYVTAWRCLEDTTSLPCPLKDNLTLSSPRRLF